MKIAVKKNTDQLNYEDFLGGKTMVATITGIKVGTKEAQYDISISEDSRVWRPPATLLKIMEAIWGEESDNWIGQRVQLFGDPNVMMAGKKVGGIRLSHVSGISETSRLLLSTTRGNKAVFVVEPLADLPPAPSTLTDTEVDAQIENIARAATTQDIDGIARSIGNRLPTHRVDEVKAAAKARRDTLTAVGEQAALDDQEQAS
ncbi:hypothetical protein ACLQ3K_25835 [Tsukamurella sp. DT100]|uniref:hypothetical protein n=1 Tax=Tsukamurella sp. DT100 TaxID=3393415 RepID=UPI003CE7181A